LWIRLFWEEPPKKINLNLTNDEIIKYLINSFLESKSNIKIEKIYYQKDEIKKLLWLEFIQFLLFFSLIL
jgi:lipoate-protein ligase A